MVIDLDKCSGCNACVVACKTENNIPPATKDQAAMGRTISWMEVIPTMSGSYPKLSARFLPRPCFHCNNPPCIPVCPVKATYLNEDGLVGQIYTRCIGCRYCTNACPYAAKYFNWYEPEWPPGAEAYQNPDVSTRSVGVVEKCTFCHHRLQAARDQAAMERRPLEDGEYNVACAESCPAKAIVFGDLEDPKSAAAQAKNSSRAFTLLEELGTDPSVIYLAEGDWHGGARTSQH
jgi:molybdopterin-containing oxidoreductase family iron-sulfur binding subunit